MLVVFGLLVLGGLAVISRCGARTLKERPCLRSRKGLFQRCYQHKWALVTPSDLAGSGLFATAYALWAVFHPLAG